MKRKRLFLSLALIPFVALSSIQASADTEYVILKNPEFTDVLKISIDTSKETLSMERCFEFESQKSNCKKIGKTMPISDLQKVHDQLNTKSNYIIGGAVLAGATYFGIVSLCIAKSKCKSFQNLIFPIMNPKDKFDWGLWLGLGSSAAGATLGTYLGDGELTETSSVLHIKSAIEKALNRDDEEEGSLVVETEASLKEIVESFSMLQLLLSQK